MFKIFAFFLIWGYNWIKDFLYLICMKMNRFKVNLHPAFFDIERHEASESAELKLERELNELKAPILQEFGTATDNFLSAVNQSQEPKILSRYSDTSEMKKDHKRFFERINSENNGKKYSELWNEKIVQGFWDLISALRENKYFDGKDVQAETAKIKEQYWNEVKDQYIDKVWFSSDKKFNGDKDKNNGLKDVLFWRESGKDYPANKIYCELTWATTIFRLDTTKVTTYDVDPQHESQEDDDTVESATTRQRIRFLAHDLPNYLWEVKDKTTLQKILGWTPIIRSTVDAPSLEDKKQLEVFIKAADKLEGQNVELSLIKVFDSLWSNATEDQIKSELQKNNLTLKKDKYIKHIKRAFEFYKTTQVVDNAIKNQHALYLSILQIVQKQWWFDRAISAFEQDVAADKERKDNEWKEYKKWKKIDENYKAFAEKLWIQDFTSATRLSEKTDEYFQNTAIVDILADLNNDWTINFADSWITKTGAQFKEIYNMVGEDVALPNLLAQAKMINGTVTNYEWMAIPDEEFTAEQIKAWNKKLILMLQNIISNPGQDLRTLMLYGPDAAKRNGKMYEMLQNAPQSPDDPRVQAVVQEKFKNLDLSNAGMQWSQVASAEWLHQAASWALYTEYMRWVGLWWKISFEEWAKWVSLNGWIQESEKWISIWLNLAYNPEINLWNGWTLTPGASIGFIPLFKPSWSTGAWVEVAKTWLSKHSQENKIWLRLSFTEVFWVAHVYSAFLWYERDKAAWIEKDRPNMKREFKTKIITPLLDSIADNFKDKEFDLSVSENSAFVELAVGKMVEDLLKWDKWKFNNKDIERLEKNTVQYLINYNKAPIANEKVRQQIADEMAENYSYAWAEQRLQDIDWKTYFDWANIWFSWVQLWAQWVPLIHMGLNFKTQRIDMYGDGALSDQVLETISGSTWGQEQIDYFNRYLLVSPEAKFTLKDWYVVIPAKAMSECDIRINSGMKWLIKKDASWNVLLSPETYMNLPDTLVWAARKSSQVLIGWWDESSAVKLKDVLNDPSWFTEWDIDTSKLTGKENLFTKESLASALNDLKAKLPDDKDLQAFNFDESILNQLEKWKKYKITLEKVINETTWEGWIVARVAEVQTGDPLQIEYVGSEEVWEMMKENAQAIARKAYSEALKVTSNRLYLISHEAPLKWWKKSHKWSEYVDFANAVKDKDYKKAKEIIVAMLPKMDSYINKGQGNNKVNFSAMIDDLNKITDDVELWQAMLSINNIFARVSSVQWWTDGKYHFKKYEKWRAYDRQIWEIIGMRAWEIERKINGSNLSQEAKDAYNGLIDFAENYRKTHQDKYKDTSKEWKILQNAVWINLWNSISIENPLFNPEVYDGSIIEWAEFNFEWKDALQERAMKIMAQDKSLMGPVLSALNIDPNSQISNMTYKDWKLSIDIGGKNVILSAEMKFGYFAQCVNHMLLLDNINAEVPWEGVSVNFWPSTIMWEGRVREWVKRSLIRTSKTGAELTVAIKKQQQEWPKKPTNQTGSDPSNWEIPTNPDGTIPEQEGHPIGEGTDNSSQPTNWGAGWSSDNIWTEWEQRWWEGATNDEYDDF